MILTLTYKSVLRANITGGVSSAVTYKMKTQIIILYTFNSMIKYFYSFNTFLENRNSIF